MQPKIVTLPPKKLVGMKVRMTLAENAGPKTVGLWRGFMPRRREIANAVGTELYSMQVYDAPPDFYNCDPAAVYFDKWAAVEVSDLAGAPAGMETHEIAGGLYAVFVHRGAPSGFRKTMDLIYREWMPGSGYALDAREHFELLGEKYRHDSPDSEEEVWVPVRAEGQDLE